MDQNKGPFDDQYEGFYQQREVGKGYDFQHSPTGSAPVPQVSFREKLQWWTLDRWRRRKRITEDRDRRQQEIFDIKQQARR